MRSKQSLIRLEILVLGLVLGIVTLHVCPFFGRTPHAREFLHIAFLILVGLAGFWFGRISGLAAAVVVTMAHSAWIWRSGMSLPANLASPYPGLLFYPVVMLGTGYSAGLVRRILLGRQQEIEQLENAEERAKAELQALKAELAETEEELHRGEQLRILGELSGELAHEIQNPLASIKGSAEILADQCQRKCGTGEFLEILMSEIKRLRGVLDRFLDYARSQGPDTAVCDAAQAFDAVMRLMQHQMNKHQVRLVLNAPERVYPVRISSEQLRQVFVNLVLNAMQAMSNGGEIHASFEPANGDIRILLRDTGPGVKEKDRERIFTPFFTTKRSGTGLGLSIVWRILTRHGGSIKLLPRDENVPGACFAITLPRGNKSEIVSPTSTESSP